jgi:hypothetical protein
MGKPIRPAMAAGVTDRLWDVEDLVAAWEASDSFRSGVLTVKVRTSRRDHEPIEYWFGVCAGAFAFLVLAAVSVALAFCLCVDLFGR